MLGATKVAMAPNHIPIKVACTPKHKAPVGRDNSHSMSQLRFPCLSTDNGLTMGPHSYDFTFWTRKRVVVKHRAIVLEQGRTCTRGGGGG